jgi:hypothetical protein
MVSFTRSTNKEETATVESVGQVKDGWERVPVMHHCHVQMALVSTWSPRTIRFWKHVESVIRPWRQMLFRIQASGLC